MASGPSCSAHRSQPSYYEVLNISSTATDEEIKQSYRSLAIKCHPDKAVSGGNDVQRTDHADVLNHLSLCDIDGDDDECQSEIDDLQIKLIEHTERQQNAISREEAPRQSSDTTAASFHEIQKAYDTLRDPTKRRAYDESLQRALEKEAWVNDGAIEVHLSEMEKEICAILYGESEEEVEQTVYFFNCRCGHAFEIIQDELLEKSEPARIWQCEGCSLSIHVNVDIDSS